MGRVTLQKNARKESGKPRDGVGMRDVAKGRGQQSQHLCWVCGAGLLPPGRRAAAGVDDALSRSWARAHGKAQTLGVCVTFLPPGELA